MDRSFYKSYFELEKTHWWFRVRRRVVFDLLKKYGGRGGVSGWERARPGAGPRPSPQLYDYGTGSGYLVGELQKAGYQAWGGDSFAEAIEYGRSRGVSNLSVIEGSRIDQPDNKFNFVLALDVLEHLPDERPVLTELKRILKPGGHLIVTAPAYMLLWGLQDKVSHHFRRYNMQGLASVFTDVGGFKLVRKTFFNTFLFLPILLVRLISKWFNKQNRQSDFNIGGRFVNTLFYLIFLTEASLLKWVNYPFGVSILLVARKS